MKLFFEVGSAGEVWKRSAVEIGVKFFISFFGMNKRVVGCSYFSFIVVLLFLGYFFCVYIRIRLNRD